jgi:hypothetical protein
LAFGVGAALIVAAAVLAAIVLRQPGGSASEQRPAVHLEDLAGDEGGIGGGEVGDRRRDVVRPAGAADQRLGN